MALDLSNYLELDQLIPQEKIKELYSKEVNDSVSINSILCTDISLGTTNLSKYKGKCILNKLYFVVQFSNDFKSGFLIELDINDESRIHEGLVKIYLGEGINWIEYYVRTKYLLNKTNPLSLIFLFEKNRKTETRKKEINTVFKNIYGKNIPEFLEVNGITLIEE